MLKINLNAFTDKFHRDSFTVVWLTAVFPSPTSGTNAVLFSTWWLQEPGEARAYGRGRVGTGILAPNGCMVLYIDNIRP